MIQLSSKTAVALLILTMKQNYGKAWWTEGDKDGFIQVGIHSPSGEVAYSIPEEYRDRMKGMIELPGSDIQGTAFGDDSAENILKWCDTL